MDFQNPQRPILELVSALYPTSRNFAKQVTNLSNVYESWRDMRADGNCLYHAFARALMENLSEPNTDPREWETFYKQIYHQEFPFSSPECDRTEWLSVLKVLNRLVLHKQSSDPYLTDIVNNLLSNLTFMEMFIRLLRRIAITAVKTQKPEGIYYESCEFDLDLILSNGQLAGDVDFFGLSLAFHSVFTEISIGNNVPVAETKIYECRNATYPLDYKKPLEVHVARIDGHYYLLYTKR